MIMELDSSFTGYPTSFLGNKFQSDSNFSVVCSEIFFLQVPSFDSENLSAIISSRMEVSWEIF